MADTTGFTFGERLAGVWGGAGDYQSSVSKLTGSPAVRLTPVTDGPATVLSPVQAEADVAALQQVLRSTFADADEASVYAHTNSNLVESRGELGDANYLMVVRLYASDTWRDKFREWLHDEHLTQQPRTGGVVWAHLYETVDDDDQWHFLNLWGGEESTVFDSTEWAEIRDTERFFSVSDVFKECRSVRQIFSIG
jgi:hypothetical protein